MNVGRLGTGGPNSQCSQLWEIGIDRLFAKYIIKVVKNVEWSEKMSFDPITLGIIVLGFANLFVYGAAYVKIKNLDRIVHPQSDRRIGMQASMSITDDDCAKLNTCSNIAAFLYTLFANIIAIFPLLGIFGTVWALMKSSGANDLSVNFSMALNTTAAGLVAAIIFKILDSFISSKLDRALDEADYLIHEHDAEKRKRYAAQTEEGHRY